ncbi:UbiD family decarboxylase [Microvirga sp. W0021]|uniref:UbiD family decarboxylase n=1 Tax=Hohaiivirga grylli TaxID=3133970 RepID=A0ABV0BHF8_9HYPH
MINRTLPRFNDLQDFVGYLESKGELLRISEPVSVQHEMTEIHRRVLKAGGPALLFEKPVLNNGEISSLPVLTNIFGTVDRVARGFGIEQDDLANLGETLASLREPTPPKNFKDALSKLPLARAALSMRPKETKKCQAQEVILQGNDIDLLSLPIQTHWSGEPAPLITWGKVITRSPDSIPGEADNIGVYRMQVLGRDRLIMRWLAHRGGAKHHHEWQKIKQEMPVAVVIGSDPATILSSVLPLPETLSELKFSGLLRGERPSISPCVSIPLCIPSNAEIVIEGFVSPNETADEGPYGDHTGYYNSVERFPVMRVTAITMRKKAVYLSTFTGRPPDEPSRIGEALNVIFRPLAQKQFPEIKDIWLPPEACSYRMAVVSINKRYPGQARRLMMGLWSMLPQFTYTKMLIVVDDDIDVKSWEDVMWAVSTRSDPSRDIMTISDTPIDYLDFASPKSGLGGKMGIDATNKLPPETDREWGEVLEMKADVVERVDQLWSKLGIS